MTLQDCIHFQLTTAQHAVFRYFGGLLSDYGVTPGQYGVLACLWDYGSLSPGQIGDLMCLEPSSVSTVLDRMQKNGLLERTIHPDNHRAIQVTLTDRGRALEEPMRGIARQVNQQVLEPFTLEEREITARVLLSMVRRDFEAEGGAFGQGKHSTQ